MADKVNKDTGEVMTPDLVRIESAITAITKGEVDLQIATAKEYPRSLSLFQKNAIALATLTREGAASCLYALPRDGKMIRGGSVRLAEVLLSTFGNCRVEGRSVGEYDGHIICRGAFWDLESNVMVVKESRRRITTKEGRRYSDDMITTTMNAAISIAIRNAILAGIPQPVWLPVLEKARKASVGDQRLVGEMRVSAVDYFKKLGIPEAAIFDKFGIKGIEDIDGEVLEDMIGLSQAIRDDATSLNDVFPPETIKRTTRRSAEQAATAPAVAAQTPAVEQPAATMQPSGAAGPVANAPAQAPTKAVEKPAEPAKPAAPSAPTPAAPFTSQLVESIEEKATSAKTPYWLIKLASGVVVYTFEPAQRDAALTARTSNGRISVTATRDGFGLQVNTLTVG